MRWWKRIIDFIYPERCAACGEWESLLCEECKRAIQEGEQTCVMCGERAMDGWTHRECRKAWGIDGLTVLLSYKDERVRRIIKEIKFGLNRNLVAELWQEFDLGTGLDFEVVVVIPLHRKRENWRGFNQSKLIAEQVERSLGIEVVKALKRIKKTKQQAKFKKISERRVNVKNVFRLNEKERERVRGKRVLLIDDVLRSGATIKEGGKVLKRAGALKVWGMVLAR